MANAADAGTQVANPRARRAAIWILATAAVVLGAIVAAGVLVWMRPLEVYAWFERRALTRAGLTRTELSTRAGRQVLWQGGRGQTVVLLHGAGDHAGTWSKVVPSLIGRHRVVVPDLPGHGDSDPREGALPIGTIYAGVADVIDAVSPRAPVTLVGNSLGAWVAMLYAFDHPDRATRLVLVNGAALRGYRPDVSLVPADRETARKTVAELTDPSSPRFPDFVLDDIVRAARTGPISRIARAADLEQHLLDGRVAALRVPVDLLWGASDRLFPLEYAKRVEREAPATRLTLIPGCGHVPQVECPDKFTRELLAVLAQAPPRGTEGR